METEHIDPSAAYKLRRDENIAMTENQISSFIIELGFAIGIAKAAVEHLGTNKHGTECMALHAAEQRISQIIDLLQELAGLGILDKLISWQKFTDGRKGYAGH